MALRQRNEADSDLGSDSDSESSVVPVKEKNRRPADNAFRQQRLKAYHPIITYKTVIPVFLAIAIIFTPLGGGMLYGGMRVQEMEIEYTQCQNLAGDTFSPIPLEYFSYSLNKELPDDYKYPQWRLDSDNSISFPDERAVCVVQFEVPNELGAPILFLYQLQNFHQNHRRYVKSYSEDQLNGKAASVSDIESTPINCKPLSHAPDGRPYYPCGLIANSMFNDTFSTTLSAVNGTQSDYPLTSDGIYWSANKDRYKKTQYKPEDVVPPPNWYKSFPDGYTEDNMPDISTWGAFQNWMTTSAFPKFRKLHLRNDNENLEPGVYETQIGLHFPVEEFHGRKSFIISTRSVIGGHSLFLGVAWIIVGGLCLVLALVFLITHVLYPRKLGDESYLSWNKQQAEEK